MAARLAAVALLALLALSGPWRSAQAQSAGSLEAMFARMARIQSLECQFHEEKRIALLSAPILTDGAIHYVRPGRLARRIRTPSPQVVLIDGASLRMWDGSREESLDLSTQPVVRSFVDSILALLAGDRATLERSYRLALETNASGHVLTLTPRGVPLDQFLSTIRFTMSAGYDLQRMEMVEVSGDVTTTTFTDVDDHRRYSESELRRFFSLR